MATALELFNDGHDTLSISKLLSISEAAVLKQLSKERSSRLGVDDPYKHSVRNLSVRPVVRPTIVNREVFVRPLMKPDWLQGLHS